MTLNKKGDGLLFDFTGSSPQAKKGINLPYHATFGACYEAILSRWLTTCRRITAR